MPAPARVSEKKKRPENNFFRPRPFGGWRHAAAGRRIDMDFAKFDQLEQKVAGILTKLEDADRIKTEMTQKAEAAEEALSALTRKLTESDNALGQAREEIARLSRDNDALSEIQESAKSKIEDLIKDRQTVLARVETILAKLS
jgi:chromosome segregation ATPase